MANKNFEKAKLIFTVISNKKTHSIRTQSVFDNRTQEDWTDEHIKSRGVRDFGDVDDMKATINWCVNGDEDKYKLKWGQSGKTHTTGYAYVFD